MGGPLLPRSKFVLVLIWGIELCTLGSSVGDFFYPATMYCQVRNRSSKLSDQQLLSSKEISPIVEFFLVRPPAVLDRQHFFIHNIFLSGFPISLSRVSAPRVPSCHAPRTRKARPRELSRRERPAFQAFTAPASGGGLLRLVGGVVTFFCP